MMTLKVGVVMGWTCVSSVDHDGDTVDQWYHDAAKQNPVTGFMNVIASHAISEIEEELQIEKAGVLLGYELWDERADGKAYDTVAYPDGWWHKLAKDDEGNQKYDGQDNPEYVPVSKLEQKICSSSISDMGYTMARLTIGDVYECTEETSNTIQASMTAAGMLQKYNYTRWQDMLIQDSVNTSVQQEHSVADLCSSSIQIIQTCLICLVYYSHGRQHYYLYLL
jgi:hypothetical protein